MLKMESRGKVRVRVRLRAEKGLQDNAEDKTSGMDALNIVKFGDFHLLLEFSF